MRGISPAQSASATSSARSASIADLLGLTVSLDKEPARGSDRLFAEPAQNRCRAVYLK